MCGGGFADLGLHKEFWQHAFCFVLCLLQFLGASELALKQSFLFPKLFIIINYLSPATSRQGRSVAKHSEHRWRNNKRRMLNDVVEITKRKVVLKPEPSALHTDRSKWVSDGEDVQNEFISLTTNKAQPSRNTSSCLHTFLDIFFIHCPISCFHC